MTEQLSDKEKALLILEESQKKFEEAEEQFKELSKAILELKIAFEHSERLLKRVINEESNQGNIHRKCEYYNDEKDFCSNYLVGKYLGLAFEVSRHKHCIKDIIENGDVDD